MPGAPTAYPGTNPVAISTTPGAGANGTVVNHGPYGVVALPLTVNGNNDITAGNIAAADQAEMDTLVWILWRLVDMLNGGTYNVAQNVYYQGAGGAIDWSDVPTTHDGAGDITWKVNTLVTAGKTITVGHASLGLGHVLITTNGTLVAAQGAQVTGQAGSIWEIDGTAAHPTAVILSGDGSVASNDLTLTQAGIARSGAAAVNGERPPGVVRNTSGHWAPGDHDTYEMPINLAGNITINLDPPTDPRPQTFTLYTNDASVMGGDVQFLRGAIVVFDFGIGQEMATLVIKWTGPGGRYLPVSAAGDVSDILGTGTLIYEQRKNKWT